jgi:Hemerythrin HHE cation binding domain
LKLRIFREQHTLLGELASQLTGLASLSRTRDDALESVALIETMDRRLVEHLGVEDVELYPLLMASDDPELETLARDYFADMGTILSAWNLYRDAWTADRIVAEPHTFVTATHALMEALQFRIGRENDVLYPAAVRAKLL